LLSCVRLAAGDQVNSGVHRVPRIKALDCRALPAMTGRQQQINPDLIMVWRNMIKIPQNLERAEVSETR
jgi:hypothetical protein